jgi:hypothetical protein
MCRNMHGLDCLIYELPPRIGTLGISYTDISRILINAEPILLTDTEPEVQK